MIRWLYRGVLAVLVLLALLLLASAIYQSVEMRSDARAFPEPGRLVDAGGIRLQINCTGSGTPTVVLESGLGDISIEWDQVQKGIAKFSRVCSYDRAGYGSSDPGPMPRTSARIANELHVLLHNAGEIRPIVLVGHSFGGYNVRVFNGQYPDGVAGMVLVDSPQEDQYQMLPKAWDSISLGLLRHFKSQAMWAPLYVDTGLARLQLRGQGIYPGDYLYLQSKYLKARASELEEIQVSAEQARAAGNLGEKPLVILTAGGKPDAILANGLSEEDNRKFQQIWIDDLQMRLTHLSTRGTRIIVQGSGHNIPLERPDSIVNAVRDVVAGARNTR
ncbi:MAG TPA: alpha/beta hydrolase [Candidatus Limnocylindrales bacterium]|nr:alpha/beta hydrolase [Candidatus Limnocylindrales bacterium]